MVDRSMNADDDDLSLQKIQISGTILASLLHRFATSSGPLHGLLFGHVSISTPPSLSDDHPTASSAAAVSSSPLFTVTSFLSFPSHFPLPLNSLPDSPPSSSLIGWFSGRRRTPLRPSLNESNTTYSITSSCPSFSFPPLQNSSLPNTSFRPSLFILLTTPFKEQRIHTHQYIAYQYRTSTHSFEAKPFHIINVGPVFRPRFDTFSPISVFPLISYDLDDSAAMVEDHDVMSLGALKKESQDQKELDFHTEGFDIGRLGRLMGSDAPHYNTELECFYAKMITKLESLTRSVEISSAKVLEQENHNMKLALKVAGLE